MGPTWHPTWHQVGTKIDQKSMSKSIKKLKPLEIHLWEDFGRFWKAKWSQVGTKMGSKMELILKTAKIKKTLKNQWKINDFRSSRGAKIDEKSIKNRLKIEAQVGVPLGIDFSLILGGLGSQVGQENRAKIEQKSKQKGIQKMILKKVPLGGVLARKTTST